MSDLTDAIAQWLKGATGASTGQDRLEWSAKFNKAFQAKRTQEVERMVKQFKGMGPGAKREILTHLAASNQNAYSMLATLGR